MKTSANLWPMWAFTAFFIYIVRAAAYFIWQYGGNVIHNEHVLCSPDPTWEPASRRPHSYDESPAKPLWIQKYVRSFVHLEGWVLEMYSEVPYDVRVRRRSRMCVHVRSEGLCGCDLEHTASYPRPQWDCLEHWGLHLAMAWIMRLRSVRSYVSTGSSNVSVDLESPCRRCSLCRKGDSCNSRKKSFKR